MSINYSPRIVTDGLKLSLDSFNPRSTLYNKTQNSLIDMNAWTASSGSIGVFGQNGGTSENVRYLTTNPYGKTTLVWEARADGGSGSDGGWNTDNPNPTINPSKMYRFSVWVKRTSNITSGVYPGTFYFGTGGGSGSIIQTSDGSANGNPYWHCANIESLTQNLWYLVVTYVYPYNTTYTGKNALEGFYTIAGGTAKVSDTNSCNIGTGLKWASTQTFTVHRTYLYYSSDAASRLQFYDPRIDVVDGTEPSIGDLLKDPTTWYDTSGNGNDFTMYGNLTWSATQGYSGFTDASGNRFSKSSFPVNYKFGQQGGNGLTAIVWAKSTSISNYSKPLGNGDANNYIDLYQNPSGYYIDEASGSLAVNGSSVSNASFYMNGVGWKMYSVTNFNSGSLSNPSDALTIGNEPSGGTYPWRGNIGSVMLYNKVLTTAELLQNFNATRTKFGV